MFGDFTYYNRHTLYSRYTPLAIGNIAQFAKQEFKDDIDVSIYKNAEKVTKTNRKQTNICHRKQRILRRKKLENLPP